MLLTDFVFISILLFGVQEAHLLGEAADDLQSIVDKWEKAVIAGIKNQNAKMQSNEQKNNTADNSDVKNQARNNSYKNIDLSTLDDSELRVYNKRGWANELFTKEDMVLLNEKFNELNPKVRQKTDSVLGDGSRIVEVNNKIVLIGGTFDEPIVHNVLVINTDNEIEAEIFKEWFIYDTKYRKNKTDYIGDCEAYESIVGEGLVRNYNSESFNYYKGRKDSGERAVLPNSFKSYGYTKQFQNRAGTDTETERGISNEVNSEKYQERGNAMSDSDLLENAEMKVNEAPDFSDFSFDDDFEDLFETEEKKIEFEKMVADSPELALQLVYKSSANTAKQVLNNSKDTKLSDIAYKRIANKVAKDYFIEPTQKSVIIENLRKLTENCTEDNFSEQFEKFVLDCKDSLFYSNMADDEHEQRRQEIKSYLKGNKQSP